MKKYDNKISRNEAIKKAKLYAMKNNTIEQIRDRIVDVVQSQEDLGIELCGLTDALYSKEHPMKKAKSQSFTGDGVKQ